VRAAGASSTSDVWAVTESGADASVLRWDGARWTVAQHLPGFSVTDMEVFSPQDIRLYGTGETTSGGLCWSHTASGWSKTTLPFIPSRTSARSAPSLLLHGDPAGTRWTAESIMDKMGRLSQFGAPISSR
jgi:hypothetical protein